MSCLFANKRDIFRIFVMEVNNMKTTDSIIVKISRLPKGYVFSYEDFLSELNKKDAVIKALNRMAASGKIAKLSKGKYYKPETTAFGELQANQTQTVKDLLEKDGILTGYLTGLSVYNKLGLSTQISNTIQIGASDVRPPFKRGRFKISFIRQKNIITQANIPLLRILDSVRFIKKIPGTSIDSACIRLSAIIEASTEKELLSMIRLARKYPPAARALLGALADESGFALLTEPLFKSLNPITVYKLPGVDKVLSSAAKWNIK